MSKIKKICSIIMAVILIMSMIAIPASADTVKGKLHIGYYALESEASSSLLTTATRMPSKTMIVNGTHKAAYCLEKEKGSTSGADFGSWEGLPVAKQQIYSYILAVGFQFSGSTNFAAGTEDCYKWAVTQLLIWEAEKGTIYFDNSTGLVNIPSTVDSEIAKIAPHSYHPAKMIEYYNKVKSDLIDLFKIPNFSNRVLIKTTPIKLKWDSSTSKYTATVTDKNQVLSRFNFQADGVTITKNGNTLTASADAAQAIKKKIDSKVAIYEPNTSGDSFIVWGISSGDSGEQKVATGGKMVDPVTAYISFEFEAVGDAGLVKISEDGDVENKSFSITGGGQTITKTTDASGNISLEGLPIYGANEDGTDGERITYTAQEVNVPVKYVIPQSQTFQLTEGTTASIQFENRLKKWRVTVNKTDSETDTRAQGDASLAGAKYGIYKDGVLQDTYTTNASGGFTSSWYICGDGWTLKEITPSEGYLLDTTTHSVGIKPETTTIEYNSTSKGVKEDVIKGKIRIIKHTDDGETHIETPETGAEFQVYLTASGSYQSAYETERDTLIIDDDGLAVSKDLPYGMYTVEQTKGWEGKEKISPFQVFISEHEEIYTFIINNRVFESEITIVKKDAETGRVVPMSGTGFKIKDMSTGQFIVQHINYPTPMDISIFFTDVTGKLMLPEKLIYGSYQLVEFISPSGYVLDATPVDFTVDGTSKTITVEKFNKAQMGIVNIYKEGEMLSTVIEQGNVYTPVYESGFVKDVEFSIYADEDIKTPDGTTRHAKDELVWNGKTDENGFVPSTELYLGRYRAEEITAGHGMVLNIEPIHFELTYAGQEITVTSLDLELVNKRQKAEISVYKSLELDELTGIGLNGELSSVQFAIAAADKITAADGSYIPADGVIGTTTINSDGVGKFNIDLPIDCDYYGYEIATDNHYKITDEKFPFTFEYAGQDISTVKIILNDGKPIENELKFGSVLGTKYGEEGQYISGAVFGLFPTGTTEFTKENALATSISDDDGKFGFENLVIFEEFLVREIQAPYGFITNETVYPVLITEDKQVIELEVWNEYERFTISGLKVDENDKPLHGVYIGLFPQGTTDFAAENAIECVVSDENGEFEFSPALPGYYIVYEIKPLEGYLFAEPYPVTIDGESEVIEIKLVNECTKLEILKIDEKTKNSLAGSTLILKDDTGKIIREWVSTDKPEVFNALPIGAKLTLSEIKAPKGFKVAKDITFTVSESSDTIKIEMIDEREPTPEFNVPKTGYDRMNPVILWVLFGSSILGIAVLIVDKVKKRKRK